MKLELRHIAGYLPYGLKVQWENKEGESNILHVIGVHDNGLLSYEDNREPPQQWLDLAVCHRLKNRVGEFFYIGSYKPLLRPLSSLYTPLEDGSVPIVELAKIASNINDRWELLTGIATNIDKGRNFVLDSNLNGFSLEPIAGCHGLHLHNQQQLFDYLYQHHFDINNLIESGLAIDINTLNK